MITKKEEGLIKVDIPKAKKFIASNHADIQRPVREAWVDELSEIMLEGRFATGSIAVAELNYNGGQTVLVNGQHQCRAIIKSGVTVDATYSRYTVDSALELSELYRRFDNHAARSMADCVRPEGIALGLKWPFRIQSLVVSAAKIHTNQRDLPKHKAVGLLNTYREPGEFIHLVLTSGNGTKRPAHLSRAIVACAMMITWGKNRHDAFAFWEQVRDGEGLKRTMPAYQLREFLKNIGVNRGNGARGYKRIASDHEVLSRSITAWNAYRRGETTALKYFADKPIPKPV